jgi:hypothetical protein
MRASFKVARIKNNRLDPDFSAVSQVAVLE